MCVLWGPFFRSSYYVSPVPFAPATQPLSAVLLTCMHACVHRYDGAFYFVTFDLFLGSEWGVSFIPCKSTHVHCSPVSGLVTWLVVFACPSYSQWNSGKGRAGQGKHRMLQKSSSSLITSQHITAHHLPQSIPCTSVSIVAFVAMQSATLLQPWLGWHKRRKRLTHTHIHVSRTEIATHAMWAWIWQQGWIIHTLDWDDA